MARNDDNYGWLIVEKLSRSRCAEHLKDENND